MRVAAIAFIEVSRNPNWSMRMSELSAGKSPANLAIISSVGPDRVGIVAVLTGHLFSLGANLRDVSFASLGARAEFSALCELPDGVTAEELQPNLAALPDLAGSRIAVLAYGFDQHSSTLPNRVTHRIVIGGGDQPGLIARLSEIISQHHANIVRLEAQNLPDHPDGPRYAIRMAVAIPPGNSDSCLNALANTAENLGLTCQVEN